MPLINEGGPAFPKPDWFNPDWGDRGRLERNADGMTRRDFFAAFALMGDLAASGAHSDGAAGPPAKAYAEWAVELADAMIAELDQFDARDEPPEFPTYVDAQGNEHEEF